LPLQVLSEPEGISQQQRQLLARLAARQLARQHLLPGNLLVLPLLGCSTVWVVERLALHQQPGQAAAAAAAVAAAAVEGPRRVRAACAAPAGFQLHDP
jgi:hypothetical protein